MQHDSRWLFAALLWIFMFTGLWRTVVRLKDAVAFGLLDPKHTKLLRSLQLSRWCSLLLGGGSMLVYWLAHPFQNGVWWILGSSIFYILFTWREAFSILESLKKD
jgi:hypothetical protein